jgi:ABC-2 type transport system ATP-binding protein
MMTEPVPEMSPVSGPALLIEHACKAYGATAIGRPEAVSDVSLCVSRGTIHGLLGPNGAGKTTTLKMLLGLVKPSAGRFEILGVEAAEPGARAPLGFLPEQPYFPSQLTAGEALTLYGRLSGLSKPEIAAQIPVLLGRVGLEGRERAVLSRFSRGMLQRLGLAQALLGNPSVLVFDEPASGLDPVGQRDVRNLMLELRTQGVTVLLSSHQLSEVENVCDEVTILNRGAVAAVGNIDALLNVVGQASFRVRGKSELPSAVRERVTQTALSGGVWVLSVAQDDVRAVVDAFDDAGGWHLDSVTQKRDSLEEYFSRLLDDSSEEGER